VSSKPPKKKPKNLGQLLAGRCYFRTKDPSNKQREGGSLIWPETKGDQTNLFRFSKKAIKEAGWVGSTRNHEGKGVTDEEERIKGAKRKKGALSTGQGTVDKLGRRTNWRQERRSQTINERREQ